ncbi:MAG TPA: RodZ domain-containing protein [Candidatus Angelobacter sp.]
MGAFGDKLRREREMRGITLAEIAESTKISKRCLKALEEEQFEVLPGGVFNRGFVRAYARFLGINEEQTVADYIAASNEQEPPADKFPLEIHEKDNNSPPLNPKRSIVPVMFALAALILVVGGWTFWMKHKPSRRETSDRHASSPATQQTSASSQPAPARTSSSQPAKAAESQSPDADKAGSSESQDQGGSISVVIRAKQNSWVSIVADGQVLWEGMLNANTERTIQAGKELVLKTGNAAGIEVSYNGKPLGALGKEKEVRTITFNAAGLQQ